MVVLNIPLLNSGVVIVCATVILRAWKDEELDAIMLKSTSPSRLKWLPPNSLDAPWGIARRTYCSEMAWRLEASPRSGRADVLAACSVSQVSQIRPSLVAGSRILGAKETMEGVCVL